MRDRPHYAAILDFRPGPFIILCLFVKIYMLFFIGPNKIDPAMSFTKYVLIINCIINVMENSSKRMTKINID